MDPLPDMLYCELRMRRERFPCHRGLAILTCITARASRTCRDACRDRYLAVFFEVGGGENVPGILAYAQPAILCIWQEAHGQREIQAPHLSVFASGASNR